MEDKKDLISRLGKQDGYDEHRWSTAMYMAGQLDKHVNFCFESLISLENKGLIELNKENNK